MLLFEELVGELEPLPREPPPAEALLTSGGGGGEPRCTETVPIPWFAGRAPTVPCPLGAALRYTVVLTLPCDAACSDSLFSWPSSPRGMPKPAESLRNSNELPDFISDRTSGLEITGTMLGPPGCGGCGGETGDVLPPPVPKRFIVIIDVLFRPVHAPPGCHPHPAPGQNDQDP